MGECFTSCTLVVDVPGEDAPTPAFKTFPTSLTVERNGTASFNAELTQSPPKTADSVSWFKDGRALKDAPMKLRTAAKGARLTLDVMECAPGDAGQYAVIVKAEKGAEVKAAFSLNVH